MTLVPHAVTVDQSVSDALGRMHALGVHHLPVTMGLDVVGVLVERELRPLFEHSDVDPAALCVGDVVQRDSFVVVDSETPLLAAVQTMAECSVDCCVVTAAGRLAGILTARDTMRLLASVLHDGGRQSALSLRPSEVRARILSEHEVLRTIYAQTETSACSVLDGDAEAGAALREQCNELYRTLLRHIELENAILAPALHDADAFGPVRAQELLREHARQREALLAALHSADASSEIQLAEGVRALLAELAIDMAHEERALLNPELLRDDSISDGQGG
jgi:CBS domain-containing protein